MQKIIIGLIVLALGIGAGWYFLGNRDQRQSGSLIPTPSLTAEEQSLTPTVGANGFTEESLSPNTVSSGETTQKGGVMENTGTTVSYVGTGFSPITLTVQRGTKVTFVNNSTSPMWVASAMHPTHQVLPGFDQKASVGTGGLYEYTFDKVGTWKYHNHVNPDQTASVVVR